jgi:WD40 repeat protein
MWITADHSFSIYGWDIEKETTNFKIQKRLKNEIIDIVELAYIKKVAIGCLDKTLQIWNLYQSQMLMKIDFPQGGLHSIVFNCPFQVLLTAGYENCISIISLDYQHQEHNLIGKLIGHNSMVTTVQCVDKTPMVVSCDDTGVIKVWDIRKLSCIQTVAMESRNVIQKIFDI